MKTCVAKFIPTYILPGNNVSSFLPIFILAQFCMSKESIFKGIVFTEQLLQKIRSAKVRWHLLRRSWHSALAKNRLVV